MAKSSTPLGHVHWCLEKAAKRCYAFLSTSGRTVYVIPHYADENRFWVVSVDEANFDYSDIEDFTNYRQAITRAVAEADRRIVHF